MRKNNKGFTLAELLIVVAIIAVLVAIMIPVMTGATEKAEVSATAANIRAAYANAVAKAIDEKIDAGTVAFIPERDVTLTAASGKAPTVGTSNYTADLPMGLDITTASTLSSLTGGTTYYVKVSGNTWSIVATDPAA